MLQAAKEAVNDMDVVLFVADCTRQPTEQELEFLQPLKASKTTVMLVLNKIDLLEEKNVLMQRIAEWNAAFPFAESFPISVSENDGVDLVEEAVCHCAIPAPHYFPDDKITDQPEQVLIAEMIREQVLRLLRDEVPHGVAVAVERLSERDDKDLLDIDATIYCERESHKGILIGKKGSHAETDCQSGKSPARTVLSDSSQPAMLGQSQRGLEKSGWTHPELWLEQPRQVIPCTEISMDNRRLFLQSYWQR